MYTAQQQQATLNTMINFIAAQIKNGDTFKRTLNCNFVQRRPSWGGQQKGLPVMQIGLADNGRHTNKDLWLAHLSAKGTGVKRSWKEAVLLAKDGKWMFVEYSHINSSPVIGSFVSDDPKHHSDALLAHELAHAVQYFCKDNNDHQFGTDYTAHKGVFKNIYAILRKEFVNPFLNDEFITDVLDMPEPIEIAPTPTYVAPARTAKPRSGAVAQCFAIFEDLYFNEGIFDRKIAMQMGTEAGLNKSTLGRQWIEWQKARGLR